MASPNLVEKRKRIFAMDAGIVNSFLRATVKVIKTMAFTDVIPGKAYVRTDAATNGDVSGIIGITGDAQGSMSLTFQEASICYIVSNMFGEPMEELNAEVEDAVGELTNMICGDARRDLAEKGKVLIGAIPTVISAKNHTIKHMANGPILAIPFNTEKGGFVVEVCLND